MSNLLTVHQNLPALPVDATSDEVRKNLMDMSGNRQAFSEHTWKMLLSVCRSWAAWCKLNNRKWFPAEPEDVRDYLLYLQARGLAVEKKNYPATFGPAKHASSSVRAATTK